MCDRCRTQVERGKLGFEAIVSICHDAGYGSIFGDGNRVEIDLCEQCLKGALGAWLRVGLPTFEPELTKLEHFDPHRHGGEFPQPRDEDAIVASGTRDVNE
jgi:hypothetical protein